jgi:hypothetical protein
MAWHPAATVGDTDPLISDAKKELSKFSYGKGLGDTDEYTVGFGTALRQWQVNIHYQVVFKGRPGPDVNLTGVFGYAEKWQMRLLPESRPAASKKVIFTVAGHLGDMLTGPAYFTARWLEERGLVRIQPIGYDNGSIPFNNASGDRELRRCINDPLILPPGTDWAVGAHSQGSIITSYIVEHAAANKHMWPWSHFKGGIQFGNPRRPMNAVAPWVTDPPPPGSEGLAHDCMKAAIPNVAEVSRKGDLYADKKPSQSSEYKTAIYRAVLGDFMGHDSLTEQMVELVASGGLQLWNVFEAIVSGVTGAVHLDQHNMFDLGPCVDHYRRILAV